MVPRRGATVVLLFVAAIVAVCTVSTSAQPGSTFKITRVVAAHGVERGQPVDPATQFPPDAGRIFVWFQATPAPRDITVRTEWYINEAHVDDASYDVTVTQGIEIGYFSLALPAGTPFPEGTYRVELTVGGLVLASHQFQVRGGAAAGGAAAGTAKPQTARNALATDPRAASGNAGAADAQVVRRPAEGFTLSIPPGWIEKDASDGAATIVNQSQPDVMAIVFVQREAASATITDVLAKASVKLKSDTTRTLVSSKFDVVLDRPALVAVVEDQIARYRLTLIPRDEENTSQIFYAVMTGAPRAAFATAEAVFDRIVSGFQIVPMTAGPAPARAPAAPGIDRAKVLERILAPKPKPSGQ